jgi:hypothetical protein
MAGARAVRRVMNLRSLIFFSREEGEYGAV